MLGFSAEVEGEAEVKAALADAMSSVRGRLRAALSGLAAEIRDRARDLAPVGLTGRLRASITARVTETDRALVARIAPRKVSRTYYAKFIEYGVVNHGTTRNLRRGRGARGRRMVLDELRAAGNWRIAPRPFMRPARESLQGRIVERLRAAVLDGMKD